MRDYLAGATDPKKLVGGIWAQSAAWRQAVMEAFDFFEGNHGMYMDRYDGESDDEFAARVARAVVENHVAQNVLTAASMLYGSPVHREARDPRANEVLQRILEYNHMDSLQLAWAIVQSIAGVAPIRLHLIDARTREEFSASASREDYRRYGIIEFELDDPSFMGIVVHPRDKRRVWAYTFEAKDVMVQNDQLVEVPETEYIGMDYWYRWTGDEETHPFPGAVNPFGTPEIPLVLLPNQIDPFSPVGRSDIEEIKKLQVALDAVLTDIHTYLEYHSAPILVFKNAAAPAPFVRKPNSVLELEGDDVDVKYLVWEQNLKYNMEFADELRKNIRYLTGITDVTRGVLDNLGNLRSGLAINLTFFADKLTMARKKAAAAYGEKKLLTAALMMYTHFTGVQFTDYTVDVEFNDALTDLDKIARLQEEALEVTYGVKGIVDMILERHPEMTREEAMEALRANLEMLALLNQGQKAKGGPINVSSSAQKGQEQNE